MFEKTLQVTAGIDLGGTAVNYTFLNGNEQFLIEKLCEHPARAREGPGICLAQIAEGLEIALQLGGLSMDEVVAIGLDTPGPASAAGVFSAEGSTNFLHPEWAGYAIRESLQQALGKPVVYLNDGNAGALWGHFVLFGGKSSSTTSVSAIIGTGLGGGVIHNGSVVTGRKGFGGELGHVVLPYQTIAGGAGLTPLCNCGRSGDLESLCSLTAIENASALFSAALSRPRTA